MEEEGGYKEKIVKAIKENQNKDQKLLLII